MDQQPSALTRVRRRVRRALSSRNPAGWIGLLPRHQFLEVSYRAILGRSVDRGGREHFTRLLDAGMTRDEVFSELRDSAEAQQAATSTELAALHRSRQAFVRSLPRARRILDLGGTDLQDPRGALVTLGYPYEFEELVIVDLPPQDRHESYHSDAVEGPIESPLGPVSYRYHSMADLSGIEDGSFDLVYSGQTFEHVSREDAHGVFSEARRVLRQGGWLCLDTPNRVVTELQLRGLENEFIDPDHEVEYTDAEMRGLFAEHGFEIARSHGLGLMQRSVEADRFDGAELCEANGLYDEIELSYLLAYVCRAG